MVVVLFRRVLVARKLLNQVWHHCLQWETKESGYMFAISWAIEKGDWWKSCNEQSAKFFSAKWKEKSDMFLRTGLYIGRLAIIYQTRAGRSETR